MTSKTEILVGDWGTPQKFNERPPVVFQGGVR